MMRGVARSLDRAASNMAFALNWIAACCGAYGVVDWLGGRQLTEDGQMYERTLGFGLVCAAFFVVGALNLYVLVQRPNPRLQDQIHWAMQVLNSINEMPRLNSEALQAASHLHDCGLLSRRAKASGGWA